MSFPMNPGDAVSYADRVARHVPGLRDMHRMCGLLLAERVPSGGRVLVLGAGGGLKLKAFADMQPDWCFDGVDPSLEMIEQATATLGDQASQVSFHQGYIEDAPEGPFDGATCLLTLHLLPREERLRTEREVYRRLKPGAPFGDSLEMLKPAIAGRFRTVPKDLWCPEELSSRARKRLITSKSTT